VLQNTIQNNLNFWMKPKDYAANAAEADTTCFTVQQMTSLSLNTTLLRNMKISLLRLLYSIC